MKRALILVWTVVSTGLLFVSCNSSSNSTTNTTSGLTFRAFISQDILAGSAGVQIINAENDTRAFVSPITAGSAPGQMVVTPNRGQTLVLSPPENRLTFISNSAETANASIPLPGFTESIVVSPDSLTAYAAVPTATVIGHSPGAIEVLSLNTDAIVKEIDVPAVRHLALGHSGNRLLAFSDNSNSVAIITFGTGDPTVTFVGGFDRPVTAFFSGDDTTAYVLNCGAECGGVQAGVQRLDLTTNTLGTLVAACTVDVPVVCSGRSALLDGTTMYLAGIPFNPDGTEFAQPCTGQTTKATSCGLLTVIDLTSMSVVKSRIVITDGVQNRIALGADGKLFLGAHTCTEIEAQVDGDEVRGCLSIYDTQSGGVVIPPANGDVTGIEPIDGRHVVYLAQGGEFQIYDTTTDKLQETQIDISGEVVDVKLVDF